MIIPSIDLARGRTVQLVGGRELALEAGDPRPFADRFGRVGEIAVVDLDAALGRAPNTALVKDLLHRAPCRVGGGIRDVETARSWLDAGARSVVLGTAATPDILRELPRERVIVALDARDGEVVIDGWRRGTGAGVLARMRELRPYADAFLVTFVEREGRLGGTDLERARQYAEAASGARLTIAGGITTATQIAALDAMGAEAQVGMSLYTGRLSLAEAFVAPLSSDRADGLWPTVVADENGVALGLAYSDLASLDRALETGRGVYHSRSRGLWEKGATSGATQELLRISADCDRDALRFTVRQHGSGFCHLARRSCFGDERGLPALARRLAARSIDAPPGSLTRRLLEDPALLSSKLLEEAEELATARTPQDVVWETADVFYFALVALARSGASLESVIDELDARALAVTRRWKGGGR